MNDQELEIMQEADCFFHEDDPLIIFTPYSFEDVREYVGKDNKLHWVMVLYPRISPEDYCEDVIK